MSNVNETHLKFFADFIKKELGIIYKSENYYQLEKRLIEIAKNLNLESVDELYKKSSQLGIHGHVKQMVLDIATNNETSFFRDPRVFKAIENGVLPNWRKSHPNDKVFRVWSVACSFGQEPYSIAMLINEYKGRGNDFPRADIRATDISERALAKAKSGIYSQLEVQRGLSAPLLVKYFKKTEDDNWQISSDVRTNVFYEKMNLLNISGMVGSFDVILCRNVLIYQN
ncbi:MAG: protein-glutamate O-methyltransferase CheR, partial [Bdellovibrionales bacterium]|nr:protein-glutamate O-methyltransferase CheR [Bdellovibrionales bacterium]